MSSKRFARRSVLAVCGLLVVLSLLLAGCTGVSQKSARGDQKESADARTSQEDGEGTGTSQEDSSGNPEGSTDGNQPQQDTSDPSQENADSVDVSQENADSANVPEEQYLEEQYSEEQYSEEQYSEGQYSDGQYLQAAQYDQDGNGRLDQTEMATSLQATSGQPEPTPPEPEPTPPEPEPTPPEPEPTPPEPEPTPPEPIPSGSELVPGNYYCYANSYVGGSQMITPLNMNQTITIEPGGVYQLKSGASGRYTYDPATGQIAWQGGGYDGQTATYTIKPDGVNVITVPTIGQPNNPMYCRLG